MALRPVVWTVTRSRPATTNSRTSLQCCQECLVLHCFCEFHGCPSFRVSHILPGTDFQQHIDHLYVLLLYGRMQGKLSPSSECLLFGVPILIMIVLAPSHHCLLRLLELPLILRGFSRGLSCFSFPAQSLSLLLLAQTLLPCCCLAGLLLLLPQTQLLRSCSCSYCLFFGFATTLLLLACP